ncbi:surface antigen [Arthrobacter sp. GAS37]|uniref:transglycosylase SLT domain-containing protein n=1 Tax=Arthrobacter sp. GAS37 TaxID=3156261 RepID=UPI003837CD6A
MKRILAGLVAAVLALGIGMASLIGLATTAAINAPLHGGPKDQLDCSVPAGPGTVSQAGKGIPQQYLGDLQKASEASGIPVPWLAAQIRQESGWNPTAVSQSGASGLTQFMPGTWTQWGTGNPTDPHAAIAAQGRFMAHLLELAKNSGYPGTPLELAFAGYNAGWGNVQTWRGIPPFQETQGYVTRIKEYAKEYGASNDSPEYKARPASNNTGCETTAGTVTGKDDYPWPTAAYCPIGGTCPPGAESPQGFYNRECVDFAMWRVNQQLGGSVQNLKYVNTSFRGDGNRLGDASTWLNGWQVKGWPTGTEPRVGAVVWYAGGSAAIGGGARGHVAIVKEVRSDGTFVEEGYNMLPNDHRYYTIIRANNAPSRFLYLPSGEMAA